MTQRLIVVSDLHIGVEGPYEIFAGATAFPKFVSHLDAGDHLVLNGDAFDYLLDDDALAMKRARDRAHEILASPAAQEVVGALRRHIDKGGQVTLRIGNHDPESGRSDIQGVYAKACPGLDIETDEAAAYAVGHARVVVAHGEANDDWNRFRHDRVNEDDFRFPPGSVLVKYLLNRAKEQGLYFADLLKPDVEGALYALLAVRPSLVALLREPAVREIATRLFQRARVEPYALAAPRSPSPAVRLDPEAADALASLLGGPEHALVWKSITDRVRAAWLRAGLYPWAHIHRRSAADATEEFFGLDATTAEVQQARELADRFGVDTVVLGHTHAARLTQSDDLVLANSGTWIPLMKLPASAAPFKEWVDLLSRLERESQAPTEGGVVEPAIRRNMVEAPVDPRAMPTGTLMRRFTYVEATADEELVHVVLRQWCDGGPRTLRKTSPRRSGLQRAVADEPPNRPTTGTIRTNPSLAPRIARLRAEVDNWLARDPKVTWEVLTPRDHLTALAERTLALLLRAEQEPVAYEATRSLVQAEATWQFYRVADGQRRDRSLGERVQWADSVAFAAYQAVMENAKPQTSSRLPLPLVFVEPAMSPATSPRGNQLSSPSIASKQLVDVPFPTVMIPSDHLAAPWWLTVIAHEIGHDLDHDLGFTKSLKEALKTRLAGSPRRDAWTLWIPEIIADIVGLRLAGPEFATSLREIAFPLVEWSWQTYAVHPPLALRLELLERVGSLPPGVAAPEDKWPRHAGPYRDDADEVLDCLLKTSIDGLGSTLDDLLPKTPPLGWCALPGKFQESVRAGAHLQEADRDFEAEARKLERPTWNVPPEFRKFVTTQLPNLAPTFTEPDSLYKIPPLALLTRFDEAWFVGVNHGQLAPRIEQAFEDREQKKWKRLVFLTLGDAGIDRIAEGEEEARELKAERDRALQSLRELARRVTAEPPAFGTFEEPFFFASYWRRDGERRVHVSPKVPGRDIRISPAVDYRAVDGQHNPALEAYIEGLGVLCRAAGIDAGLD